MRYALLFSALIPVVSGMLPCDPPINETWGGKWTPSWIHENQRQDLRCKQDREDCTNGTTLFKYKKYDTCCACRSCPVWEGTEIELFLELISVSGKSLIIYKHTPNDTDVVFKLQHTNGGLAKMPSNLCNWDNDAILKPRYHEQFESMEKIWERMVKINFKNNKISTLTNLTCLHRLDEINMNNNKLTYISNTSFTSLTYLRRIYFSGNLITKIDPGILTAVPMNLFDVDFSNNKMKELDVSNMLSLYPFCAIGFESNEITQLVNEANFKLDTTKTYGPGFVLFNNNDLQTFPDFKELLHLDDITQLGSLLNLGFNFSNIPLTCDCHFEEFHSLAADVLKTIVWDHMNVKCVGPPELAGKTIPQVQADQLICKLPADSGCPTPECNCTDQPSKDTLYVDCSIKDEKQWLDTLPAIHQSKHSNFIELDISGHRITDISNITLLRNIKMLKASNNNIREINDDVVKALENATVDLSNNSNMERLPKLFLQYRNVCTTYMKNLLIDCNCDSLWIETWLKSSKCNVAEQMFNCQLPNKDIKPALEFRSTDVDCSTPEYLPYVLTAVTVFLILLSTTVYKFRYELLIIYIRLKQVDRWKVLSHYNYDVFLSFNDDDVIVTKWVDDTLEDNLRAAGYRVFQAGHDVTFGAERNSEVLETINKTCNFLLILSDGYLNQDNEGIRPWTENEWKYGWHNFMKDKYKNLIIINFDHISSFDVNQQQIKAFLRVGCTIDFRNHHRKIIKDVCGKLGKPFYPQMKDARGLENMKPKLSENVSFTANFDEQSTSEQETSLTTPILKNDLHTRKKYLQNLSNSERHENDELTKDSSYKQHKGQRQSHALMHNEVKLERRPINSHTKNQKSMKTSHNFSQQQTPESAIELSQTYKLCKSVNINPSCKRKSSDSEQQRFKSIFPMFDQQTESSYYTSTKQRARRGETNFTKVVSYDPENKATYQNIEEDEDLFQLNMNLTNSERSLSVVMDSNFNGSETRSLEGQVSEARSLGGHVFETRSLGDQVSETRSLGDHGSETRSLGGSSNSSTTSIGSSTLFFNSKNINNTTLTEISYA
ncbi:uncharacterized protein LOC132731557 [Ruditapes philippinarum]|uniref:uncharacterized protein LOC132731557 n=1 Tax=Ruditapes philippinarum TaxID=129788 RepID=UPI00295AFA5E|nr:uncharacterized protein LOC132731557 [Ruditapes philippinarum]